MRGKTVKSPRVKWRANPLHALLMRRRMTSSHTHKHDSVTALTTLSLSQLTLRRSEAWQCISFVKLYVLEKRSRGTPRAVKVTQVSHDTRLWRRVANRQAQREANYVAHPPHWGDAPRIHKLLSIHLALMLVSRPCDSLRWQGMSGALYPHPCPRWHAQKSWGAAEQAANLSPR